LPDRPQGNCLVWIEAYEEAPKRMPRQLAIHGAEGLNGLAGELHPWHASLFERDPASDSGTGHQSEGATDIGFRQADFLKRRMPLLMPARPAGYCSADVRRDFGRKVNQSGAIPANFSGTRQTDRKRRQEGARVNYRRHGNAAQCYDQAYRPSGSVRPGAEPTLPTVQDFRGYRSQQGGPEEDLPWRPMRQGIADRHRPAEGSPKAPQRWRHALASVDDRRSVEEGTEGIPKPAPWGGRKLRGWRAWAADQGLFPALNQGELRSHGCRNRELPKPLYSTEPQSPGDRRHRSAAIRRKLRLLRAHGLIQKVPHPHRYQVTASGRAILVAVLPAARTSVNPWNQLPKAA
jgi:hypothetical protein